MKLRSSLILAGALAVALSGCATNPLAGDSNQAAEARHDTGMAALKGGAIGCGAGALSGIVSGNLSIGSLAKRCFIGGAAGAVVGAAIEYRHQLKAAQDLAEQARNQGLNTVVTTRTVDAIDNPQDKNEKPKPETALDRLTINLKEADVRAHGPTTEHILVKAAEVADTSTTSETLTLFGSAQDRAWMSTQVRSALKPNTKTTVVEQYAAEPRLELSPVPAPVIATNAP